ncbi:MAG: hypothetical protein EWM72_00597 [Nitrospira sp.]|nr:MAG: hypothetical protein EWM72_00597 [Nitrospira sp.]
MRYVSYNAETGEIKSAISGPPESLSPEPGFKVGDAGDAFYKGSALKNYVFIPDEGQAPELAVLKGVAKRKPKEEWDLEAEAKEEAIARGMERCHCLDMTDVARIEVFTLTPAYFVWLSKEPHSYSFSMDNIPLTVSVIRADNIKDYVVIGAGIPNLDLRQSLIKFSLTGKEDFIARAVNALAKEIGNVYELFVSTLLQTECLKFSVRVANQIIECYRVAYDDPRARPIGFADALNCDILVVLRDGHTCRYQTGNPLESGTRLSQAKGERKDELTKSEHTMQTLLAAGPLPFIQAAVAALKSAHLYGQSSECVVWAGTIINNVIEDFLLDKLDKNSSQYQKLKKENAKVSGVVRRGEYFELATGLTLEKYLERIIKAYSGHKESDYWERLPKYVEDVIDSRNSLIHRQTPVSPKEGEDAFYTCMNFLYAIYAQVPYSVLYSRDINLKLTERFI